MLNRFINIFLLLILTTLGACASITDKKQVLSQVQNVPDVARIKFTRAVWAAKSGLDDQAIALFSALTREYPLLARPYTNLGMLHLKKRELTSAEQALQQAVRLYPYDAIAQNHLGVVLRELGKFQQAEQAYLKAIKYNETYSDAYLNLGVLYDLYLHDLPKALLFYKQGQTLADSPDELVKKWIIDAERRVAQLEKTHSKKQPDS